MANGMPDGVKNVLMWGIGIGSLALFLLIMVIIFGNLSGNVGFGAGSVGYNDTQNLILNYTKSATNTAAMLPTVGTILGVVVLLVLLIGVLVYAIRKMMDVANTSGKSNGNFS